MKQLKSDVKSSEDLHYLSTNFSGKELPRHHHLVVASITIRREL